MNKPARFVVCAAIRKDGILVAGARHYDSVMRNQLKSMGIAFKGGWEQGFIDQHGKFLTRTQAWKIAEKAGQIRNQDWDSGEVLFSENLY